MATIFPSHSLGKSTTNPLTSTLKGQKATVIEDSNLLFPSPVLKTKYRTSLGILFQDISNNRQLETLNTELISTTALRPSSHHLQQALSYARDILHSGSTILDENLVVEAFTVLEKILDYKKNLNASEIKNLSSQERFIYANTALELGSLQLEGHETWYNDAINNLYLAETLGDLYGHASYLIGKVLLKTAANATDHVCTRKCREDARSFFVKSLKISTKKTAYTVRKPNGHAGSTMLLKYIDIIDKDGNVPDNAWDILEEYIKTFDRKSYQAKLYYYLGKLGYQENLGHKNKDRGINTIAANTEILGKGSVMRSKSLFYIGEHHYTYKNFAESVAYLYKAVLDGFGYIRQLWKYLNFIQSIHTVTKDSSLDVCKKLNMTRNELENAGDNCVLHDKGMIVKRSLRNREISNILFASSVHMSEANANVIDNADSVDAITHTLEMHGFYPTKDGKKYIREHIREFYNHENDCDEIIDIFPDDEEIIYLDNTENYDIDDELEYSKKIVSAVYAVISSSEDYDLFPSISRLNRESTYDSTVQDTEIRLRSFIANFNSYLLLDIDKRFTNKYDKCESLKKQAPKTTEERHKVWNSIWDNKISQGLEGLELQTYDSSMEPYRPYFESISPIKNTYQGLEDFIYWYSGKNRVQITSRNTLKNHVLLEKWKEFERCKWPNIEKKCRIHLDEHKDVSILSISLPIGVKQGVKNNFTSVITPFGKYNGANNWNKNYPYPYNNKSGVCTHNRVQYRNICASFLTELKVAQGENQLTLFKAIRHGVLDAYNIVPSAVQILPVTMQKNMIRDIYIPFNERKDVDNIIKDMKYDNRKSVDICQAMRTQASLNFAKELVVTAVNMQGKLPDALAGDTVEVTITSVSLLSPYWSSDEAKMLDRQIGSYKGLFTVDKTKIGKIMSDGKNNIEENTVKIQVHDNNGVKKTITIKPTFIPLNCGVNKLYYANVGVFIGGLQKGISPAINGNAVEHLREEVVKFLDINSDDKKKYFVTYLMDQIEMLHNNSSLAMNKYALPMCVTLLAYALGHAVAFNCKSGKDRTGILDSLIKCYMAYYHETGELLTPDFLPQNAHQTGKIPPHINESIIDFLLHSGSFEVQKLVAGFPGYKVNLKYEVWIRKLFNRDTNELALFLGGSSRVKAWKN